MNEQLQRTKKYFTEIIKQGSITLAAQKLYVSQPSLSKFIQRLEDQLQVKLFDRSTLPIRLTHAGELYRDYLEKVSILDMELMSELSKFRSESGGKVVFSCSSWRASLRIPQILSEFGKVYPNIEIVLLEAAHSDICSLIENGSADIGITSSRSLDRHLSFHKLSTEPIYLVVNVNSPILQQVTIRESPNDPNGYVDIREFKDERFIVLRSNQMLRSFTEELFVRKKLNPKQFEVSNINTAMGIVASGGGGVSFLPAEGVSSIRDLDKLRLLRIGDPPFSWELGLVYNSRLGMTKDAAQFFRFIDNYYKQHSFLSLD